MVQELAAFHASLASALEDEPRSSGSGAVDEVELAILRIERVNATLRALRRQAAAEGVAPEAIQRAYELGRDGTRPSPSAADVQQWQRELDQFTSANIALTAERDQLRQDVRTERSRQAAAHEETTDLRAQLAALHQITGTNIAEVFTVWQRDTEPDLARLRGPLQEQQGLGVWEEADAVMYLARIEISQPGSAAPIQLRPLENPASEADAMNWVSSQLAVTRCDLQAHLRITADAVGSDHSTPLLAVAGSPLEVDDQIDSWRRRIVQAETTRIGSEPIPAADFEIHPLGHDNPVGEVMDATFPGIETASFLNDHGVVTSIDQQPGHGTDGAEVSP